MKLKGKRLVITLLATTCFFLFKDSKAQLSVSNTAPYNTASYMVQNVLVGTGVTVSNITYNGSPSAMGFFNGTASNIGLDSGLIMASGDIANAVGPNSNCCAGNDNGFGSDPDLLLISTNPIFNACILEFDFIPMADTVKFRYVFGSEEYPEYTCCTVNDAFGFFISGPGITGPYSLNAENIAVVPSTTTGVSINTLNGNCAAVSLCGGGCCGSNSSYYFDNETPPGATVQYDGFTVPMTAIHAVQCGQTYHIKLAIGDAGDGIFDSGVFLEAGSFTATSVTISTNISYGSPNDSTLYEGCGQACIIFDRGTANLANPDTVLLTITGSAVNGTDYSLIPDTLFFAVGQDSIVICINGIQDFISEGMEIINISAQPTGPCAVVTVASVYLSDYFALTLAPMPDTTICGGGSATITANPGSGVQPYNYLWTPTGSTTQSITVSPTVTTTYFVNVGDSCNSPVQTQSVTVFVTATVASVTAEDILACAGEPLSLTAATSGGGNPYTYSWVLISGGGVILNPGLQTTVVTGSGTYQITVTDICGTTVTDLATVSIDPDCNVAIPNVFTPNNDLFNEYLSIKNLEKYPGSRLVIYNRWGNIILDDKDYKNNWNGKENPEGVYYFVLNVADKESSVFTGFFELLR